MMYLRFTRLKFSLFQVSQIISQSSDFVKTLQSSGIESPCARWNLQGPDRNRFMLNCIEERGGFVCLNGNFSDGGGCVVSTSPVRGCLKFMAAVFSSRKIRRRSDGSFHICIILKKGLYDS